MRFRPRRAREEPEINLIPLIDVLLVILIFLMITTTYSRYTELKVNLPTAEAEKATERPGQIVVSVTANGVYSVDKQVLDTRDVTSLADALRNAAVPIVTVIGVGIALLIGGVVVTESVFNIPGLGRLTVDAVLARDYPTVQAVILLFSVELGWLPASGYVSPWEDPVANLKAMAMPAFVLGTNISAVLMRHTRSAMLQVMSADYVRTARAKGLSRRVVILRHALRNALTPVITLGALELGTLLSGAVLTEQVFTIPGFGKLIVDAVFNRDYAVVQGVVLVTGTAYILLNLLADIAYILVNPRLRS